MKAMLLSALGLGMCASVSLTVNPAQAERPFMDVLGATSPPIGYVELCERQPAFCDQRTNSPTVVQLDERAWADLLAINAFVNNSVEPVTDADLYGRLELWTMPSGYGDCEDYVLLKRDILIEHGWPASALLITVVREPSGAGHAVLTVRTDRGEFILDNQMAQVLRWDETPYRFIKRQSEFDETIWASIHDNRV